MRLRPVLLLTFLRHLLPVTLPAVGVSLAYVMTCREPLVDDRQWPLLFVIAHSLAAVWRVDAFRSGWFAFYRTRGFTSRCLAAHGLLAALASSLVIWGIAAVPIWSGLRAEFQDHLIRSPYAPFLARLERAWPLEWLGAYLVLIPVWHYALVRKAQPTAGAFNGLVLAVVFALAWSTLFGGHGHPMIQWLIWGAGGVCAAICLTGGIRLHRQLEVRA